MRPRAIRRWIGVGALSLAMSAAALAQEKVGWVELEGAPLEKPAPFAAFAADAQKTLRDVVQILESAAERSDLSAVVIRLREPTMNAAQVQEIGSALDALKRAGKKVYLFTEIYGPNEILLGAYADEALVQKGGAVSLPGIYMEEMFLADTLAMLGVKADFVQIGKYKGASETFGRSEPSEAWEQNISGLLDGLYGALRSIIKSGRGMSDAELDRVMEDAWLMSPEDAVKAGLVDAAIDRLELEGYIEKKLGDFEYAFDVGPEDEAGVDMSNPFALMQALVEPASEPITRDTLAIVHINGAIVDGESADGGLFGQSNVGSLTIREALAEIEMNDLVRGVIVRIDSPGGSAIASESIWLGLQRVAEKKPVWVSVGSMAASGGYYIAVGGDRIYLNPSSIVGSIGVVGGKYAMGGLYAKINANVVPRTRGPRAGLFSTVDTWSDAERELIRGRMEETYDLFVSRVKAGRKGIDISKTAEGRLFAGQQAVELRMADRIGGLDDAITDLASKLNLREGRYDVMSFPRPKSFAEALEEIFGGFGMARAGGAISLHEAGAALKELVGPRAWPGLRDSLAAMWQMREEPVLLTMPRALIFR